MTGEGARHRNVSFRLDGDGNMRENVQQPGSPPKSVLKQKQSGTLPPPARYQHADPLLRRLRLIDGHGKPVDLKREFRDTKIVIFYFGSQWHAGERKGAQRLVASVCRQHPHEVKVVYVSVDTDIRHYEEATRNKPWLAMEWHDGSSLDPDKPEDEQDEPPEQFLLADDADPDERILQSDTAGTSYVRPFSRVYMACKFEILLTPTLVVYHLPTRRILDSHVRLSRLRSERMPETLATWLRGEPSAGLNWVDVMYITPWTFILLAGVLIYFGLRLVLGDQLNLSNIIAQFG